MNNFIKNLCDDLAREGNVTFAPDLYHGKSADSIQLAQELLNKRKGDTVKKDILDARKQLQSEPTVDGKKIGLIGILLGACQVTPAGRRTTENIGSHRYFYGTCRGSHQANTATFLGHYSKTHDCVSNSCKKNWRRY